MDTNDGYDIKYFLRPFCDNKVFFVSIFSIVMVFGIYFSVTLKKYWISEVSITPVSSMITRKMNITLPSYSYINNKWEYDNFFKPQFFIDEFIRLYLSKNEKERFYLQTKVSSKYNFSFEKINKELLYRYDQKNKEHIFYAKTINPDYGHDLIVNYTNYIYKKMREEIENSEKERNLEELMILNNELLIQKMRAENNKSGQISLLRNDLLWSDKFNFLKSETDRKNKVKSLNSLMNSDYQYSSLFLNNKAQNIEIKMRLIKKYLNNINISKENLINIDNQQIIQFKESNYNNVFIILANIFLAALIAMFSSIVKFSLRRSK